MLFVVYTYTYISDIFISANNLELSANLTIEKNENNISWEWIMNVASKSMDMHTGPCKAR